MALSENHPDSIEGEIQEATGVPLRFYNVLYEYNHGETSPTSWDKTWYNRYKHGEIYLFSSLSRDLKAPSLTPDMGPSGLWWQSIRQAKQELTDVAPDVHTISAHILNAEPWNEAITAISDKNLAVFVADTLWWFNGDLMGFNGV